MIRSIYITLIVFVASVGVSQNSDIQVKDVTAITSKTVPAESVKIPAKEEVMGTRPKSPNLDSLQMMPYNPSNENQDKKTSSNDKNTSKPH